MLNWECLEDEGEQIQGADVAVKAKLMYSGTLTETCREVLDERCHNEFEAIREDIQEAIKANSKGSTKLKDSTNPSPTYSPDYDTQTFTS